MNDKSGTNDKLLEREIVTTADGSSSIRIPAMNEMYHSHKGAINESKHVYIDNGYKLVEDLDEISILEIGMGTGLNVVLTYLESISLDKKVHLTTLEPYPLVAKEYEALNFDSLLGITNDITGKLHRLEFEKYQHLGPIFVLEKLKIKLEDYETKRKFNLVYFDAFAPNKQSSLWHISNIKKVYNLLEPDGILTTYCSQGQFKRDLRSVGFEVNNPEGPMGKREITVAIKK